MPRGIISRARALSITFSLVSAATRRSSCRVQITHPITYPIAHILRRPTQETFSRLAHCTCACSGMTQVESMMTLFSYPTRILVRATSLPFFLCITPVVPVLSCIMHVWGAAPMC
jgi:hypothetical protein